MKAAGYVRVSTEKQAESGLSLDEQQRRIAAYAESQGWTLERVFVEAGVSGRRDSRPELDALLEQAQDFGVVIVPKLDRLGRSAKRLLELYDEFESRGLRLIVLTPTIDTSTPAGRLLRTVLAAIAEFESELIGERTAAVMGARARAGKFISSNTPYGYRRAKGGLVPDPIEAEVVRRIFREWAVEGRSQRAIARGLHADGLRTKKGAEWTQARVRQVLTNHVHVGKVMLHGEEYAGAHEPLIEPALWERAQARRTAGSARRGRPPRGAHLFTKGLLRCAHCGSAMSPRTATDSIESYVCLGRQQHGAAYCEMTQVPRAVVDTAAFGYFERVALDVETARAELEVQLRARRTEARLMMEDAKRDVAEWEQRKDRVDLDYLDQQINADEWRQQLETITAKLEEARRRLSVVTQRVLELHPEQSDPAQAAREEVERRVAELRQAVAGEVATAEGLEQVRAQLARLFERFDIGRTDLEADPAMPPEMREARERALEEARCGLLAVESWVIVPWARAGVAEPLSEEWRPPLGTEPEGPSDKNTPSGSSRGISSWPAFLVRRYQQPG